LISLRAGRAHSRCILAPSFQFGKRLRMASDISPIGSGNAFLYCSYVPFLYCQKILDGLRYKGRL